MDTLIRALERRVDSLYCFLQSEESREGSRLPDEVKDIRFTARMTLQDCSYNYGSLFFWNDDKLYYCPAGRGITYLIPASGNLYSMIASKIQAYYSSLKDEKKKWFFEHKYHQDDLPGCYLVGRIVEDCLTLAYIKVDDTVFRFDSDLAQQKPDAQ